MLGIIVRLQQCWTTSANVTTSARQGYYTREQAEELIRRWPDLALYSHHRPEPGGVRPGRTSAWNLEHLLCLKADVETAWQQVRPRYRAMTASHYRDMRSHEWIAQHQTGGMGHPSSISYGCRVGREDMIAWLTGATSDAPVAVMKPLK